MGRKALQIGLAVFLVGCALFLGLTLLERQTQAQGGGTIYVDGSYTGPEDGSQDHPWNTIGEGLDDASDGDTILVAQGVYTENITVDKEVTLEGGYESVGRTRDILANGWFELSMTKVFWATQVTQKETEFGATIRGDNILNITLFSPTRKRIFATTFFEWIDWVYYEPYESLNSIGHEYYKIGEPIDMERKFPLGDYTFLIWYYDSEDERVKRETLIRNLEVFPPRPIITYPEHDQIEVELEPLIEWERAPDDPKFRNYFVAIGIPDPWVGVLATEVEDIDQAQFQVPPGVLQPDTTYHVWVGIVYDGILASKSGIQFTTVGSQ